MFRNILSSVLPLSSCDYVLEYNILVSVNFSNFFFEYRETLIEFICNTNEIFLFKNRKSNHRAVI